MDSSTIDFWGPVVAMAAFGFTGSLHCAGMCGPLAAAACARKKSTRSDALFYHASRIFSYTTLGFLFGLFSSWLVYRFEFLQQLHAKKLGSITAGLMLFYAIFELFRLTRKIKLPHLKFPHFRLNRIMPLVPSVYFGLLTAALPCGFLYAAILQAVVIAHPVYSALGMMAFAVSTAPALSIGSVAAIYLKKKTPRFAPFLSVFALLVAAGFVYHRSLPRSNSDHCEHDKNQ